MGLRQKAFDEVRVRPELTAGTSLIDERARREEGLSIVGDKIGSREDEVVGIARKAVVQVELRRAP